LLLFETSQEYLSILIFGYKHQAILFNDLSLQVVRQILCESRACKKTIYTRQSELLFLFRPKCPFEPALCV